MLEKTAQSTANRATPTPRRDLPVVAEQHESIGQNFIRRRRMAKTTAISYHG
jgi:hypothetical protein